ncbi:MAG: hypothetical protein LQ351_001885 [Letrouitia transgressa]|nr:MAG: hypothetical protein LQ351_001885 [Letrouitia transgressa]
MPEWADEYRYYLGNDRYCSVPEDILTRTCPVPGTLCARCQQLDIRAYFLDADAARETLVEEEHLLDTFDNILNRSQSCHFCTLVVGALRARSPEVFQDAELSESETKIQSLRVFLKGSFVGICEREFDESAPALNAQLVCCIALYLDKSGSTAAGLIRLLCNDAHLIGQHPLFHGRLIDKHIPLDLLFYWLKRCIERHGCGGADSLYNADRVKAPRSLVLIDPINERLIKKNFFDDREDYLALSYVWGGQNGLQLKKDNRAHLFETGALGKNAGIPSVIRDAMSLVKSLDPLHFEQSLVKVEGACEYRRRHLYLWVDQLCITQDDDAEKNIQIQQMGHIFSEALATIMAMDGQHCNENLFRSPSCEKGSGVLTGISRPSSGLYSTCDQQGPMKDSSTVGKSSPASYPRAKQVIKNIGGLRLIAALPHLDQALRDCRWMTRAWTLQEREVSRSAIYFSRHQVYFHCHQDMKQEDIFTETFDQYRQISGVLNYPHTNFEYPQELYARQPPIGSAGSWPEIWETYTTTVENYMSREMTYPADIFAAFRGVAEHLHSVTRWDLTNCFPTNVIDYSLLWRPSGKIRRRIMSAAKSPGSKTPQPPTYTWAAWIGRLTYQPYNPYLKSLVKRFERLAKGRTTHVLRYSQRMIDPDQEPDIEPNDRYGPRDAQKLQNMGQSFKAIGLAGKVRNLAFAAHLTDKSSSVGADDGSFILQFRVQCIFLRLMSAEHSDDGLYTTRLLLNHDGLKVGFAWHVPLVDQLGITNHDARCLLLSKYKTDAAALEQWTEIMGPSVDPPVLDHWDLVNLMVVYDVPNENRLERITIGKVHENYLQNAREELVRLA